MVKKEDINPELIRLLKKHSLPIDESLVALTTLLSGLNVDWESIPVILGKLHALGIIEYVKDKPVLKIPLYNTRDIDELVENIYNLYSEYAPKKRNTTTKAQLKKNLVIFLSTYDFSNETILGAIEKYLREKVAAGDIQFIRAPAYVVFKNLKSGVRDWFLKQLIDEYLEESDNTISNLI